MKYFSNFTMPKYNEKNKIRSHTIHICPSSREILLGLLLYEVGTSLYLLVTTELSCCRVHNLGCCTHGCIQDFKGRWLCLLSFWLHVDLYTISFRTTLQ